ncbi:hypothetical protein B0G81_3978 [Paraburkholderia sp. BL6665CI2N2]|uniref:hypothetical protein n=1 Tax=Paraburkholderia sp. BL6665CI2N2 TaxID=1938806 RepID=UPI0010D673CF|nr:hypothetical protein [Paraburkholderia sp. BL6665CI2N2]TDY23595.1 hypothetical protein B0G81_3978 [Paraburkholderia sp. BL6665CI2N2]
MTKQTSFKAGRGTKWDAVTVAKRAVESFDAEAATRSAEHKFSAGCERYKESSGIDFIDTDCPKFRHATRTLCEALQDARRAKYNAARRLATAVRNYKHIA